MADINATTPVVAPAVGSITYDKWFLTQIVGRIDDTSAPLSVRLRRAAKDNAGHWLFMANDSQDAEISFTVDAWKEITNTPEIAAAIDAVLNAVLAYGTKKHLL